MRTVLTLFLVLFCEAVVQAQTITDDVKQSFGELKPIKLDVDGDGRVDTLQPRVYAMVDKCGKGKPLKLIDVQHWISFDLMTARGRRIPSIFKYKFGTSEATYWVYALVSARDINADGKTDFVFYSGDDTSEETIELIYKGNRFVVHSKKVNDSLW